MRLHLLCLLAITLTGCAGKVDYIPSTSSAQNISFTTGETGFEPLNFLATELQSTTTTPTLSIPNFKARTAVASRWMMCVYTNVALMRHKKFWNVVYPIDGNDVVTVGFPESESREDLAKLGPDFLSDHALKTIPTEKMLLFCVHAGYKFKYVSR